MNTLLQLNDQLAHMPAGVIAMLFSIALGYVLKMAQFFPNRFIPVAVIPLTALLYAGLQICADLLDNKPSPGLYFLFNFMLGFVYGFVAWVFHAQILKRFLDPRIFNDDGSTKFFNKPTDPKP